MRVAVIDSGIDVDHPLLGGCVDEGAAVEFLVDGDGTVVERAGPHRDVFGHGTACARDLRPFQLKTVLWSCAANVREGSAP